MNLFRARPERGLVVANLFGWLVAAAYFATLHDGLLDFMNHAIGRDFVNLWTAGRLTVEGRLGEVFDPEPFQAAIHRLVRPEIPFHFWSYPPPALFLAAPLGLLPYGAALVVWTLFGIGVLYAALRLVFPGPDRLLLMLSPAVACNVILGQNGAVTAALLIGGLALMPRRPLLAGVLMGLLVFKPQLGLLLPVIVIAGRHWRTLGAAALTAAAVLALSFLVFGAEAWRGFLGPTLATQAGMMANGEGPFLWMMTSAFAAGRLFGLHGDAMLLQLPFLVFAALLAWKTYRSDAPALDKLAVGLIAGLVASPQSFNYDLIPALAATLILIRRDPAPARQVLGALMWVLPFFGIALAIIKLPAAPLLLAAVLLALYDLRRRPAPGAAGEPTPG